MQNYFMKLQIIAIVSVFGLFIFACSSSKKATSSTTAAVSLTPGDAELKAIQVKYADVSMQTLNDGYAIYSGPCTKCHGQKDIFSRSEQSWKHEIDEMAPKAKITDVQKDALWKYVLAMKATHPSK